MFERGAQLAMPMRFRRKEMCLSVEKRMELAMISNDDELFKPQFSSRREVIEEEGELLPSATFLNKGASGISGSPSSSNSSSSSPCSMTDVSPASAVASVNFPFFDCPLCPPEAASWSSSSCGLTKLASNNSKEGLLMLFSDRSRYLKACARRIKPDPYRQPLYLSFLFAARLSEGSVPEIKRPWRIALRPCEVSSVQNV